MSNNSKLLLAKMDARMRKGQELAQLKTQDLVMRQQRRAEAEEKRAEKMERAEAVKTEREQRSQRATAMIGGAGGHEGGAPSPVRRPANTRVVPAGHGVPAMVFLDEGRFVADGGHGSTVRRRPADKEFSPVGIRGEVVRTTGMSQAVTNPPVAAPRPNAAGNQPVREMAHATRGEMFMKGGGGGGHVVGTSQGRYVPRSDATDNSAPTPSPARPPHIRSGKHDLPRPTGKSTYKEGGIVKAKRVGKPSAWISHVKSYQNQHGCSYREAMVKAKATYQK
jgi:hypothetical protein